MKKLSLMTALIALLVAVSAFAVYEARDAAQHRKPAEPTQSAQPSQPSQPSRPPHEARPALQAQPRGGHTAPADAPKTGQAAPRRSDGAVASHEPDRAHLPSRRGPIVIPYPVGPWWGYPYPGDYPPYGWRIYGDWQQSFVRLDVEPNDAQVYVDDFYAGVVDDFDGMFQHLALRPGPHLVEVRKTGFVSLAVELNLYPAQSITYRRTMEPSGRDAEPQVTVPIAPAFEEGATPPVVDLPPGDIKFDVSPKDAEVYADGFYAGIVDDFNGSQHLQIAPGRHHIELKMNGYKAVVVEVSIESGRSITYRTTLKTLD